jgi:hypothetical protein
MSIISLEFPMPVRRRLDVAPRDFARRDCAIQLFESNEYLAAIAETLAYLLPSTDVPVQLAQPLCLIQGSARAHVAITSGELHVSAALIRVTENSQSVAALRFFLSRLSATGQLFQPRWHDGVVSLSFNERVELLHPLKLIEVMQRLPSEADGNDAWLAERFGVEMSDREPIAPLSEDEFAECWRIWQGHWAAVEELLTESRRRRQVAVLDSLGSFAINHLVYTLPLFGPVRARLNECADNFTNRDDTATKRDSELAKTIKEMRQVTPEQLRVCLGHANYALNPAHEGTPSLLTSILGGGNRMQKTGEHRAAGRGLEATLELMADYLYLLAHHSWSSTIDAQLRAGLTAASLKPWREAADVLWNHANTTAKNFGSHGERDQDSDAPDNSAEFDDPGAPGYDDPGYDGDGHGAHGRHNSLLESP